MDMTTDLDTTLSTWLRARCNAGDVERGLPDASPRLNSQCPNEEPGRHSCWKCLNPDPAAPWDFYLLLAVQTLPGIGDLLSLVVPTPEGGLFHGVKFPILERSVSTLMSKTLEGEAQRVGPLSLSKLKVRTVYQETQHVLFGERFLAARYSALLAPSGGYVMTTQAAFPALPAAPAASRSSGVPLAQLDLPDLDLAGSIHFPTTTPIAVEEDLEVDGGELVEPEAARGFDAGAPDPVAAARPPGFYLDVLRRQNPALCLAVFSLRPVVGPARIAFVDYCAEERAHEMSEQIFVKKRKSWFKRKVKIRLLRQELHQQRVLCGTLTAPGIPAPEEQP